jgi:uncharacterized protein YdcH (DUF465 family)
MKNQPIQNQSKETYVNPLTAPANYDLATLLKELKFGRPANDQLLLQKWIDELCESKQITMIENTEDLIKALCIMSAGWRNDDEKEVYLKASELINKTAYYIHLLNQKEKLDDKISTYNQNELPKTYINSVEVKSDNNNSVMTNGEWNLKAK